MAVERGMFRQAHRDRTSYRKLTEDGVRWIRARRDEGMTIAAICDAFKAETGRTIGKSTVGSVVNRELWIDVE